MKRTKFFIILLAIMTLFLSACSATKNVNTNDSVEESDIRKLVYNYSVGNIKGEKASITSNELIITKSDGKQEAIDISNEDFFVSIAPYVKETHPCQNHSLTGCQGEMPNTEFYVYIEDFKGNVIVDETKKSFANGFIDLWLPRNMTYKVFIRYDNLTAEGKISTTQGSNTCVTTLQLK